MHCNTSISYFSGETSASKCDAGVVTFFFLVVAIVCSGSGLCGRPPRLASSFDVVCVDANAGTKGPACFLSSNTSLSALGRLGASLRNHSDTYSCCRHIAVRLFLWSKTNEPTQYPQKEIALLLGRSVHQHPPALPFASRQFSRDHRNPLP